VPCSQQKLDLYQPVPDLFLDFIQFSNSAIQLLFHPQHFVLTMISDLVPFFFFWHQWGLNSRPWALLLEPLHHPFFVKGFSRQGLLELFSWAGFKP
jgi:hypothetical protein